MRQSSMGIEIYTLLNNVIFIMYTLGVNHES